MRTAVSAWMAGLVLVSGGSWAAAAEPANLDAALTAAKGEFDAAQKQFKRHKASMEGTVKAKADEQQNLQTKRNKIAARLAKVDGEVARIADANSRGLNEAERRRQERQGWEAEVANLEMNMSERLTAVRTANAAKHEQLRSAIKQLATGHEQLSNYANGAAAFDNSHPLPPQQYANPLNPWNQPPPASQLQPQYSTSMWPANATAPGLSSVSHAPPSTTLLPSWTLHPSPLGPVGNKARGRSSSMLSDVSGFTQSSSDDVPSAGGGVSIGTGTATGNGSASQPALSHPNALRGGPPGFRVPRAARHRSDGGSGSGTSSLRSGSGSAGSARDPTSPI